MAIPEEYFVIPKAYQHKAIPMSWGCCCTPNNIPANQNGKNGNVSNVSENVRNSSRYDIRGDEVYIAQNNYDHNSGFKNSEGEESKTEQKDFKQKNFISIGSKRQSHQVQLREEIHPAPVFSKQNSVHKKRESINHYESPLN